MEALGEIEVNDKPIDKAETDVIVKKPNKKQKK